MIKAQVILDSHNPVGVRLTTFVLQYPRFIHAELLTHRNFSRNSSSSRAISIKKMIEQVRDNTALPNEWPAQSTTMWSNGVVENPEECEEVWRDARDAAIEYATQLTELGAHKQIVNRLLEPFMHIQTLVSATDWKNFFSLRISAFAQPEIKALANSMKLAMDSSVPTPIDEGGWHIPFQTQEEAHLPIEIRKKISVAKCARVSYFLHPEQKKTIDEQIQLHDRLMFGRHLSPFEHCAQALGTKERVGNFRGWKQYRKFISGEDGELEQTNNI